MSNDFLLHLDIFYICYRHVTVIEEALEAPRPHDRGLGGYGLAALPREKRGVVIACQLANHQQE